MDLRVADGVAWQVTTRGVRLFAAGHSGSVAYPDAIIWDLLARRRPWPEVREVFALSSGMDPDLVEPVAQSILNAWRSAGWIEPESRRG